MQYFSLSLSQKLASLGITSESGMYFVEVAKDTWNIHEFIVTVGRELNTFTAAYQMSDVFHKEALIKVFGKGWWHINEGDEDKSPSKMTWQYHRDRMIEIYSEEGLIGLSRYLEENL